MNEVVVYRCTSVLLDVVVVMFGKGREDASSADDNDESTSGTLLSQSRSETESTAACELVLFAGPKTNISALNADAFGRLGSWRRKKTHSEGAIVAERVGSGEHRDGRH